MAVSAEQFAREIESYLADHPHAIVVEGGETIFDFSSARYSLTPERDKCVLQIWSEERNVVRRVVGAELKNGSLRLSVVRFGQSQPARMELCAEAERRAPSTLRVMRANYQRTLHRILERTFSGWTVGKLSTSADLERSFGPAYTRGVIHRGRSYLAVVGVGAGEAQPTVDAIVSIAVLWLEQCRERLSDRGHVEGAAVFVPAGRSFVPQLRLAHLHPDAAQWHLFATDDASETATRLALADLANLETRLVQCPSREKTLARFSSSIERIVSLAPLAEVVVVSASELSFRLHGLEFARADVTPEPGSFRLLERITFGAAPAEFTLSDSTESFFQELVARLVQAREHRNRLDPLYRMHGERWLESIVKRDVSVLDDRLNPACVYAQVPAFAARDRAMIDLLGVTREGRLAVIELKADEDLHLPMQGLDYWARVRWHHRRGEFQKHGYFPGRELSPLDPLLIMAAPALHVHPTTDTLLRYLSPEIEWKLVGLDERWRDQLRVVFRKKSRK